MNVKSDKEVFSEMECYGKCEHTGNCNWWMKCTGHCPDCYGSPYTYQQIKSICKGTCYHKRDIEENFKKDFEEATGTMDLSNVYEFTTQDGVKPPKSKIKTFTGIIGSLNSTAVMDAAINQFIETHDVWDVSYKVTSNEAYSYIVVVVVYMGEPEDKAT